MTKATTSLIRVTELYRYPVKSCKGEFLHAAKIDRRGIQGDRSFMLIDSTSQFITQRKKPRMALIQTQLTPEGVLLLSVDGMDKLTHEPIQEGNRFEVKIWKDKPLAIDQGDIAADWFTQFLGTPCRLVTMPNDYQRQVNQKYAPRAEDQVGFADGFPFLLIGESSLLDLNERLIIRNKTRMPMNSFRPNIVIAGSEAYEEDTWKKIQIGEVIFEIVRPCSRCAITTVNQETGITGLEPLTTLNTYRKTGENKIMFGQNMTHANEGIIQVGDPVQILEKGETPNFKIK